IPKYQKWEPALLSLTLFAISAGLSAISTPLTNALNAIGRVKITLYLMIFWTITTWALTPLSIMWFGFNGVSFAAAVISVSVIAVVFIAKRYISFEIGSLLTVPVVATTVMGFVIYFLSKLMVTNILMVFVMIVIGVAVYFAIMFLLGRKQIIADVKSVAATLKK
ncbi:polysaccharide biosynthesis C-terminal domain-containing protein, partial [Candidatus Microgenomates bacterium]|nr:polysaccharide biosynthesis C-terminal domain-containing protein [Candidatus Microgenomates bacterium]